MPDLYFPSKSYCRAIALKQLIADHVQNEFTYHIQRRGSKIKSRIEPQVRLPGMIDMNRFDKVCRQVMDRNNEIMILTDVTTVIDGIEASIVAEIIATYRSLTLELDQQRLAIMKMWDATPTR